ncbi:MAG: RIP metalloprotease RseP [Gammaproteobacteria bacterium]|nr:RIP metalloprotease RseP [Gammaproteobacteria bacterium]
MPALVTNTLWFIVAISVLVAVHEYGHFWVARRLGFKVLRFSVGFGSPLLRWRSKKDGVEYWLSAIPLGGYVKMLDEREEDVAPEEVHRAFNRRPIPARIAVLFAGPAANFLFAIAAYWLIYVTGVAGVRPYVEAVEPDTVAAEAGLRADDVIVSVGGAQTETLDQALVAFFDELLGDGIIELGVVEADGDRRELALDVRNRVSELTEPEALFDGLGIVLGPRPLALVENVGQGSSAAADAGIEPGDRIVAIEDQAGDQAIKFWSELVEYVRARPGEAVDVVVERGSRTLRLPLVIDSFDDNGQTVGRIGISTPQTPREELVERLATERRYGPIEGIGVAIDETWQMTALTSRMLWRMITGEVSLRNASGPIMIGAYAGDYAQAGFNAFLRFLCLISISLGIMNLLPVPILDGGQIVMSVVEWVKGAPLSMRAAIIGQQIGLAMLILLMGFVFYNDITRLLGQ